MSRGIRPEYLTRVLQAYRVVSRYMQEGHSSLAGLPGRLSTHSRPAQNQIDLPLTPTPAALSRTVTATPTPTGRLSRQNQVDLAETLGKTVYTGQAPRLAAGALNPNLNWKEVEERYLHSSVVAVDDFLSPAAVESLRSFCLESTVWHQIKSR